ncbi:MAG: OmpH family outer membrane protein [Microscillaceae bacterium]|nr:OmpH family outer membrane protein [Microscillaceae bacterium]
MKKIYFTLVLFTLFGSSTLFAQNKMGYFDLQKVLPQVPAYLAAQKEMETYGKQIEAEVKAKQDEFQKKLTDYQKGVQEKTLTPALAASKERELQSLQQQFQQFQQTVEVDAQNRELKLMTPIYEKIEAAITKVSEANSFKYVLKSEFIAGANKANDISNLVLKEMGITPKPE